MKSESEHQNSNDLNGSLITTITKDAITTLSCDHHDSQTEDGNHKDHCCHHTHAFTSTNLLNSLKFNFFISASNSDYQSALGSDLYLRLYKPPKI